MGYSPVQMELRGREAEAQPQGPEDQNAVNRSKQKSPAFRAVPLSFTQRQESQRFQMFRKCASDRPSRPLMSLATNVECALHSPHRIVKAKLLTVPELSGEIRMIYIRITIISISEAKNL